MSGMRVLRSETQQSEDSSREDSKSKLIKLQGRAHNLLECKL